MITVYMYNPHVPVLDVLTFLACYVEGAGITVNIKNLFGNWSSKLQVKVKLRADDKIVIIHAPSLCLLLVRTKDLSLTQDNPG